MTLEYTLEDVEDGRVGNLVPAYHVRFPPAEAERLKAEAARRRRRVSDPLWWERARLSFHGMVALADHYGVLGKVSDRSGDVRLTSGVSLSQPKSMRQRDLLDYARKGYDLFTPWPVDRRIGDYIVARSVMTNPDGSSSVFLFGAISKEAVQEAIRTRPHQRPRVRGGSPYVELMLEEYDADLLRRLLGDTRSAAGDNAP